jgi:hypothetical protein
MLRFTVTPHPIRINEKTDVMEPRMFDRNDVIKQTRDGLFIRKDINQIDPSGQTDEPLRGYLGCERLTYDQKAGE